MLKISLYEEHMLLTWRALSDDGKQKIYSHMVRRLNEQSWRMRCVITANDNNKNN